MKVLLAVLFSLFLFNSCTNDTDHFKHNESSPEASPLNDFEEITKESTGSANSAVNNLTAQFTSGTSNGSNKKKQKHPVQKIIYSADMSFQVANVNQSTENIKSTCNKYGAHISKMNMNSETYRVSNTIQIRVSEDSFDKMIEDFKKSSVHMDELNIKSNDVTAEFIDVQSRLKTKKASRNRYITVLQTKAGTVEEIISAEEAIRRITEEIEAKEGRLRYLRDKVKFSTITLNIYETIDRPETTAYVTPYLDKAKDGFGNGWSFIVKLTLVLINLWPLMVVIGLVVWKRKWFREKLSSK